MGDEIERLADELLTAWDGCRTVPLLSARPAGLDTARAYAVAEALRRRRVARGERVVGWKIGFTNRRIWPLYGVFQPMWAPVWDTTTEALAGTDCTLPLAGLCQPRIEPEIAFGLKHAPRAGMSLAELQGCIDWVAHAFEIVHTHFDGWKFTAADTAADFALHGRLRVGPRVPIADWPTLAADLSALEVTLQCDGQVRDHGRGEVVLDGPLQALQQMVQAMARDTPNWRIEAGDVVSTGTITDAQPLLPGQVWQSVLSQPRLAGLTLRTLA
jgi:2-oxo-3-hexenedioate decarboxylase